MIRAQASAEPACGQVGLGEGRLSCKAEREWERLGRAWEPELHAGEWIWEAEQQQSTGRAPTLFH